MAYKGNWVTNEVPSAAEINDWEARSLIYATNFAGFPATPAEPFIVIDKATDREFQYTGAEYNQTGHYSPAGRAGFHLRRAANQAIADATDTFISWDTADLNSGSAESTPTTFVTPHATTATQLVWPGGSDGEYAIGGVIKIVGALTVGTSSSNHLTLVANRGGVFTYFAGPLQAESSRAVTADGWQAFPAMPAMAWAAGDTLSVELYQSSAASRNVIAWLDGVYLGR